MSTHTDTNDAEVARVCRAVGQLHDYSLTEFEVAREAAKLLDMDPREVRLAWQRVRDNKQPQ